MNSTYFTPIFFTNDIGAMFTYIFYTKLFAIFTPIYTNVFTPKFLQFLHPFIPMFLHQNFCNFYTNFFIPSFLQFFTPMFLHQFFTPKFLQFLHQFYTPKFCFFNTIFSRWPKWPNLVGYHSVLNRDRFSIP